jgi:aryl-alcohol dehydrogenase-like predicted oxidoreductase
MEERRLGAQGLTVSALGLGCMGMTWAYSGGGDAAESEATLLEAVDSGVTLFDTAEVYGPFTNEQLVGRLLGGARRDRVVIATKFGFRIGADGQISGLDSRPAHIREAVDASLARLGVGRIDLLYQHRVDPAVPIEDVVGTMADLVRAGKVRYLGLSEASAATLKRAHAVHPISALQSEYSLWERGIEGEILSTCRTLGVGVVPYSPLGRGFLTGGVARAEDLPAGDFRRNQPRLQGDNYDQNMALVARLRGLGDRIGASTAQIALAWLLGQGPDVVPIFGTTRRTRLRENLASLSIRLASCDQFLLDQTFGHGTVSGARYNEAGLALLDRR